jgi:hypothetical protein
MFPAFSVLMNLALVMSFLHLFDEIIFLSEAHISFGVSHTLFFTYSMLSFFKFPKWVLGLINSQMANCLWNDFEGHRKLHLANWSLICKRKAFGGIGIPNLDNVNLCLLSSWVKRYEQDNGKLWKTMVDHKYNTCNPNIFCCNDTGTSQFWKGVMWAVKSIKFGYRWHLGNGKRIRFWEDTWVGNSPLCVQFFEIYAICNEQGSTVD